jgi:Uma2 family endonuclease
MAITKPRHLLGLEYDKYAEEYLRSLPPEHFMEATGQSIQREITLESLALVKARRPDVHVFSELLVQYPYGDKPRPHQVVPDNMVVIYDKPIHAKGSYKLPLQPVGPYWVLEYVSKESERKDYDDNMQKYEHELKVPYYLIFYPDEQELTLYRHTKRKYVTVKPNLEGRLVLSELNLEMALVDGWCRFWYKGELLPLPVDLLQRAEQAEQRADRAEERAEQAEHRAEQAEHRADRAEERAEHERLARLALEQELERLKSQMRRSRRKRDEE